MLVRLTGVFIVVFWAASMGWLFWHDVWPGLTAGDPPRMAVGPAGVARQTSQVGIFDRHGRRIGTAWSEHFHRDTTTDRNDLIVLDSLAGLGRLAVKTDSVFTEGGRLDEFTIAVWTDALDFREHPDGGQVRIRGQRFASKFGVTIEADGRLDRISVSESDAGLMGDVFRPFSRLPDLHVGQSWRMQVVNPLAAVSGLGNRFVPMLVRVTRQETITLGGGSSAAGGRTADCFVVEAPNVTAWVTRDGLVLKQEVELPLGGKITLLDEPFDLEAKLRAHPTLDRDEPDATGGRIDEP